MILIRCPNCKAVFRAGESQLRERQGRVRCGKCATSFNGLENLVEAPPAPAPAPVAESAPVAAPAPKAAPTLVMARAKKARAAAPRIEPTLVAPPAAVPEPVPEPVVAPAIGIETASVPKPAPDPSPVSPVPPAATPIPRVAPPSPAEPRTGPSPAPLRDIEVISEQVAPPPPPAAPMFAPGQRLRWLGGGLLLLALVALVYVAAANWTMLGPMLARMSQKLLHLLAQPAMQAVLVALALGWLAVRVTRPAPEKPQMQGETGQPASGGTVWRATLVSLVLLLALLAQAVYVFRTDLASLSPAMRTTLEEVCSALVCTVPLPRRSDWVSIEASDLHPVTGHANQLQLLATVRNRATYRQDWPHLEVTLTDARDKPVVRRVFAPAEYLPADNKPAEGFAASQDLQLELTLEVDGLAAAGYRIYVFYP